MLNTVEQELELENECSLSGIEEYRKRGRKHRDSHNETLSDYGKKLVALTIEPLSLAIDAFLESAGKGAGRKNMAVEMMRGVDSKVLALICTRVVMDSISSSMKFTLTATWVGAAVQEEHRLCHFEAVNPALFSTVERNLDSHPDGFSTHTRRRNMRYAMKKFGVVWAKWTTQQQFHVGSKLIDLLIESTGMIELHRPPHEKTAAYHLVATEKLQEFITNYSAQAEVMRPLRMPMIVPPTPWTTPYDGGYLSKSLARPLIKASHRGYLTEIRTMKMPQVYECVNALQNTTWKVNTAMLDAIRAAWDAGVQVEGLPLKYALIPPAEPQWVDGDEAAKQVWASWKREAAEIGKQNRANISKQFALVKVLSVAEKFRDEPQIWFPATLDFRGRVYFIPQHLNPQASDISRGLLTFANAKPLGERGVYWLAVHIANCFGFDKASLDDRASWSHQHTERLYTMANDPQDDLWWVGADKPFQFLAAAMEWAGVVTDGPNHECSLPISVDGSCNGLQHFAAMTRDEVCGAEVNLTNSPASGDVYAAVARRVEERVREDLAAGGDNAVYAAAWLEFGIDRKLCKRPVMVVPYGGTIKAVQKYLEAHVYGAGRYSIQNPTGHRFGRKVGRHVGYITSVVWGSMAAAIQRPLEVMGWIKGAASLLSKEGLPITWTTPTGFLVSQRYYQRNAVRVKTKLGGSSVMISIQEENLDVLDKRKQRTALSPNFVHSLDASALMLTVQLCQNRGVHSFHAIHDSYGTHASDMDTLAHALREVFVGIYTGDDILGKLKAELEEQLGKPLPPLPPKGSLDISGVLLSPFFFS